MFQHGVCFDLVTVQIVLIIIVNFKPLFEFSGFKVNSYPYFNKEKRCVDFENILKAVTNAPSKSIFVLQPCAHNPTGADLTAAQWQELADAMKVRTCLVFPFWPWADTRIPGQRSLSIFW